MVSIEEVFPFFCYRLLIDTYRLAPEVEASQLAEILRRVRKVRTTVPLAEGGRAPNSMTAGGPN